MEVIEALRTSILVPHDHLHIKHERMFAPIAARFVLVDTEGWFWIRTVGAAGRRPS
jgi:hypothetical protein